MLSLCLPLKQLIQALLFKATQNGTAVCRPVRRARGRADRGDKERGGHQARGEPAEAGEPSYIITAPHTSCFHCCSIGHHYIVILHAVHGKTFQYAPAAWAGRGQLVLVCLVLVRSEATCSAAQVIRPMYSSPPRHGAAIVVEILSNPQLYREWRVRTPSKCPLCGLCLLHHQSVVASTSACGWYHCMHCTRCMSHPAALP